ncbi:cellulase family glycosylhydrolase [Kutzneria kofuensis]|uniref:cellulase family glycosylhydrolase n=1 Tax=Kutzneria kofuensis TaxID=103725 RepID=UPI0035E95F2E
MSRLIIVFLAVVASLGVPVADAATSTCAVAYSVGNSWAGGFQAGITITNNGPAISSWTLAFAFPDNQQITNGWGGTFSQNGRVVQVANQNYNGSLATGASATVGFVATVGATNGVPTYFTVNGLACNGAAQQPFVALTSPAANQNYLPGAAVAVAATASEPNAAITKVQFFATSIVPGTSRTPVLIGTSTAAPYTATWANVPAGYYRLTAQAVDSAGATATSPPILINVVPTTSTAPRLRVSGNQLLDTGGHPVVLRGTNRSGGEFACVQNTGIWNGPVDQPSVTAMKEWGINAVRVPLNEACWNGESYVPASSAGAAYQAAVRSYVNLLNNNGIVAILDLHWTDGAYNGTASACASAQATCQKPMPDTAQAVPFWTSVAGAFKGNDAVIFDLFNEPYPDIAAGNASQGWQCWRDGGSACTQGLSYPVAGMQTLVDAVRSTGADNVLMLGGLTWSNDMTQWLSHKPVDPDNNLVASWHSYNFNACSTAACWTSQIAPVAASVPLIAGEIGENECSDTYITPLMTWLDSQHIGYLPWTWNAWGCAQGNVLIADYDGTPTAFGAGYRAHLQSLLGG